VHFNPNFISLGGTLISPPPNCDYLRKTDRLSYPSVAAGRVIFSGSYQGFGRIVAIQHGKHMSSFYAHFDDLRVAVGQLVHRGTVLGVVGSSGKSTGTHLHFEVRVGGIPIDPQSIF
jgi:murein DD-endopeptidase MepM/ murein hydrolase activator NlpD